MPFGAYSSTPSANTSIAGNNISEGGPPSAVNNAIRQIMADARLFSDSVPATQVILAAATQGVYANAAKSYVPRGLTQASVGAITPGSGGTNGTFDLTWTGGNFTVNPTGTFTVTGGALTSVNITGPGQYIGLSANPPTPGFGGSLGLSGASVVLTAQPLVGSGVGYWVVRAGGEWLDRYVNNSGAALATPTVSSIFVGDLSSVNAVAAVLGSVVTVASNITAVTGASAAADRAQNWAESASAPGGVDTKSAKSWADDARATRAGFPNYFQGAKGEPGGNILAIGLFSSGAGMSVPAGTSLLQTSGWGAVGEGPALYSQQSYVNAAWVTANPRTSFLAADGRGFSLHQQQPLTIQMFGGRADGGYTSSGIGPRTGAYGATDNSLALRAALEFISAIRVTSGALNIYRSSPEIRFPNCDGVYDFVTTVEIRSSVRLTGDNNGMSGNFASCLRWRQGQHGLILLPYNAKTDGTSGNASFGADGFAIDGLCIIQHSTGNDLNGQDFHAIWQRCRGSVTRCNISYWSGNGIHAVATAGGGGLQEGNLNSSYYDRLTLFGNESGIMSDGGDSNACYGALIDCQNNRRFAIWDSSFLGNTWLACHADGNGLSTSFGAVYSSQCTFNGRSYYVKSGAGVASVADQENGASANAPSGTTADTQYWGYRQDGAADGALPWSSNLTWRMGGAYCTDSVGNVNSTFVGCYSEANNGVSQFVYPTIILGGIHAAPVKGNASYLRNELGNLVVGAMKVTDSMSFGKDLFFTGFDASTTPGSVTKRKLVYDVSGTPLGYMHLHDS